MQTPHYHCSRFSLRHLCEGNLLPLLQHSLPIKILSREWEIFSMAINMPATRVQNSPNQTNLISLFHHWNAEFAEAYKTVKIKWVLTSYYFKTKTDRRNSEWMFLTIYMMFVRHRQLPTSHFQCLVSIAQCYLISLKRPFPIDHKRYSACQCSWQLMWWDLQDPIICAHI